MTRYFLHIHGSYLCSVFNFSKNDLAAFDQMHINGKYFSQIFFFVTKAFQEQLFLPHLKVKSNKKDNPSKMSRQTNLHLVDNVFYLKTLRNSIAKTAILTDIQFCKKKWWWALSFFPDNSFSVKNGSLLQIDNQAFLFCGRSHQVDKSSLCQPSLSSFPLLLLILFAKMFRLICPPFDGKQ